VAIPENEDRLADGAPPYRHVAQSRRDAGDRECSKSPQFRAQNGWNAFSRDFTQPRRTSMPSPLQLLQIPGVPQERSAVIAGPAHGDDIRWGDQKRGFVRNVTDEARNDLVQYPVTSGQCSSPGNDRRLRGEGKLDLTTLHGKSAERQADPTGVSPSQWQTDRTGRAARNHRVSPTRRACSGRQLP